MSYKYEERRLPGWVISENGGYDRDLALASVGPGWASLINRVFDALERLGKPTTIVQVKEKYGGLRIYTDNYVAEFEAIIQQAELESFAMCETCGEPGVLRNNDGWYITACDLHGHGAEPIPEEDDNG